MHYSKKIPFEQDKIHLIIKSFEDGEYEYKENFKEHPTVTQNGRGAAIWNHIHTQLVKNFSLAGYKTGIISRGPWDLVYLFDEKTRYLYTFMRDKNYMNLRQKNIQEQIFHYSNILGKLNGQLLGTYEPENQQLSFGNVFTIDEETDAKLETVLKKMISSIGETIERYAIVLVDCKNGAVNQIECIIPIAYMNPLYREDWSKFIKAEYSDKSYNIKETLPEEDEAVLLETNSDIALSFRDDKRDNGKVI